MTFKNYPFPAGKANHWVTCIAEPGEESALLVFIRPHFNRPVFGENNLFNPKN